MSLLRARNVSIAFTAYFGLVAYLAWRTANETTAAWFSPAISLVVYQTSIVSGVVVLAGLFIAASMSPRLQPATPESGLMKNLRHAETMRPDASGDGERTGARTADSDGGAVDPSRASPPDLPPEGELEPLRLQEAAAVSAALSRLSSFSEDPLPGSLSARLSEIRSRRTAAIVSEGHVTARYLVRLVDETRPLLLAARQAGLNVDEASNLMKDAIAREDSDIAQRVRLVEQTKDALEAALVERVADDLRGLLVDVERAKAATANAHTAELAAAEAVALLDTGNYMAAMERTTKARQAFQTPAELPGHRDEVVGPSLVALVGPSIVAVAYVAISAILIPAVYGFLERNFRLNTAAILGLSYGWVGLALFALASVFIALRPARRAAAPVKEPQAPD